MYKWYSLRIAESTMRVLSAFAFCVIAATTAFAQNIPVLPTLSLTGGDGNGSFNRSFYPDGRIWVTSAQAGETREILVPVFIRQTWASRGVYTAQPIYSFQFKMQYDSSALRPLGVVTRGPVYTGNAPNTTLQGGNPNTPALADGWTVDWNDSRDTTYLSVFNDNTNNRLRGRRLRIEGVSTRPLQPTETQPYPPLVSGWRFAPLLYVRFQVVGRPGLDQSDNTAVIITSDSCFYNTLRAGTDSPFPGDGSYASQLGGSYRTVAGETVDPTTVSAPIPLDNYAPGTIQLKITDPARFTFAPTDTTDPNAVAIVQGDNDFGDTLFMVKRILGFDPNAQADASPVKQITVNMFLKGNNSPDVAARVTNIVVESDKPWLQFASVQNVGQTGSFKNPFSAPRRSGIITYMDRGILGPTGRAAVDPANTSATNIDPTLNLRIICDPSLLPDQDNPDISADPTERAGKYVGYITVRSQDASLKPIRLKVEFLYVRSPDEKNNGTASTSKDRFGMSVIVRNSAPTPRQTELLFGTGLRATLNADSLFGEFAYQTPVPVGSFYARWFPTNATDGSQSNGLGDFTNVYASRDIRNIFEDTTLVYHCRFDPAGATNYPVLLLWDENKFPVGAKLFLRSAENGPQFGVDMRETTIDPITGLRTFTIRDERIREFFIEYTPARATRLLIEREGWNLISIPVRPSNSFWKTVLPNAMNTPLKFALNIYQSEESVRAGVGYFVRFPRQDTTVLSGILIREINRATYPVELYRGWNTIGSLSIPSNIDNISFDPIVSGSTVRRISGVYGYTTDRGYREVSEIQPGFGYWLKINGDAYYQFSAASQRQTATGMTELEAVAQNSARVVLVDAAKRTNEMFMTEGRNNANEARFELPPAPMADMFDVRFGNNGYVSNSTSSIVRFQGATYPVSIGMNNNSSAYTVVDAVTGDVIGQIGKGNGNVVITNENINAVRLLANDQVSTFAMNAYPNPSNGMATIEYTLPSNSNVSIVVYNVMGQPVQTVINGLATKGENRVDFDGSSLPTGQYLVKVVAGDYVATRTINIVK